MRSSLQSTATRRALLSLAIAATTIVPASTGLAGGPSHGPIYRTLDALAGGIEAVIDLAESARGRSQHGVSASCDDGCDTLLAEELSHAPLHLHEHTPFHASDVSLPPELATPPISESAEMPRTMPAPKLPMPPRDLPRAPRMAPQVAQPIPTPRSSEDEWAEKFPSDDVSTPTKTPSSPVRRSPAETYDSLPDPFSDDPQSKRAPRSKTQRATYNQPASYWEPW